MHELFLSSAEEFPECFWHGYCSSLSFARFQHLCSWIVLINRGKGKQGSHRIHSPMDIDS